MRGAMFLVALFLMLFVALRTFAQQGTGSWAGTNPRNVQFKPIDTSSAFRPGATDRAFRPFNQPRPFSLDRFFPKLNVASWPPRVASSFVVDPRIQAAQPPNPTGFNVFAPTGSASK